MDPKEENENKDYISSLILEMKDEILRNPSLSIDDIIAFCQTSKINSDACNPSFWRKLLKRDFNVVPTTDINPRQLYIQIYSENDVTYGSEKILALNLCLYRALLKNNISLVNYFLQKGADDWDLLSFMSATIDNEDLIYYALVLGANPIYAMLGALSVDNQELAIYIRQEFEVDDNYDMIYFYLAYWGHFNPLPENMKRLTPKDGLLNRILPLSQNYALEIIPVLVNILGACAGRHIDYLQETLPKMSVSLFCQHVYTIFRFASYGGSLGIINLLKAKLLHDCPDIDIENLYYNAIIPALYRHNECIYINLSENLSPYYLNILNTSIIETNNLQLLNLDDITEPENLHFIAILGNYTLFKQTADKINEKKIIFESLDYAVFGGNKLIVKKCLEAGRLIEYNNTRLIIKSARSMSARSNFNDINEIILSYFPLGNI